MNCDFLSQNSFPQFFFNTFNKFDLEFNLFSNFLFFFYSTGSILNGQRLLEFPSTNDRNLEANVLSAKIWINVDLKTTLKNKAKIKSSNSILSIYIFHINKTTVNNSNSSHITEKVSQRFYFIFKILFLFFFKMSLNN